MGQSEFFSKKLLILFVYKCTCIAVTATVITSQINSDQDLARCSDQVNKTGIYSYGDKKFCNVFHECFCNDANESFTCDLVKSNVCPLGKVFHNLSNRCEPIETLGCESLYLQWINGSSDYLLERDIEISRSKTEPELESNSVAGISEFVCPYGSNERFADPQICNVFHVCVSRGEQTYDQPFLCPYSSIFRVIDSNTMYCDRKNANDCKEKAFYRSSGDDDFSLLTKKSDSLLVEEAVSVPDCENNEIYEDELYCNTYHVCKEKKDRHFMCENNLLFNPLSRMCDYPINVICSFKQIFKKDDFVLNLPLVHQQQEDLVNSFYLPSFSQVPSHPPPTTSSLPSPSLPTSQSLTSQSVAPLQPKLTPLFPEPKSKEKELEQALNVLEQNLFKNMNNSIVSVSSRKIFGTKIDLKCPDGAKNYLFPDTHFCNIFHHCDGVQGNIMICEKGQAFDPLANGPEASGVCNFENLVDCEGKFILTEMGKRTGQPIKPSPNYVIQAPSSIDPIKDHTNININNFSKNTNIDLKPENVNAREELISGIKFDCRSKSNGHWRDHRYCDVFHACISSEQKKTYSCAQLGERIYFNETTKRCEFLKYNPSACFSNTFFNQLSVQNPINSKTLDEPNENWKFFIRSREQFACVNNGGWKADGFYASRWCNVFYRCFMGIKTEFLCPKMLNSDRLWWVQHGSSQEVAQTSAACVWPCETKKQCSSLGGTIIQLTNGTYIESVSETERVWRTSSCGEEKQANNDIFKISDSSFSCIGLTEGSFYASKYCNIFHRCTSGKRKDFKCPKATNSPYDLWWNPITKQCDWPCKVNCDNSVYGSLKSSLDIRKEDYYFNEDECRRSHQFQQSVEITQHTALPHITTLTYVTSKNLVASKRYEKKLIDRPFPDDFVCPSVGLFGSEKYCNVYYECKIFQKTPYASYQCIESNFDPISKACSNSRVCVFKPALVYPFVAIEETSIPEEVSCSYKIGSYVIHSNRYCNIHYTCNGRSAKPQSFRCFDKQSLTDGIYSKELNRCVSKSSEACNEEYFISKPKYQSSPIQYQRLSDLQPLACRSDQQYLAEHDKYCNLFHSCILGKYQMYSCVAMGTSDRTSFFYYTNGDCSSPNVDQCGPNKSIYPYSKLFPDLVFNNFRILNETTQLYTVKSIKPLPLSPKCVQKDKYIMPDINYCNVYYECMNGNLLAYVCVDHVSGNMSGIYDNANKKCKAFNTKDCPSGSLYTPESETLENNDEIHMNKKEEEKEIVSTTFRAEITFITDSNFSCAGLRDAYYESEYCNVYYRCVNGKRIDSRCSSGKVFGSNVEYDLWWVFQNITFDSASPYEFKGDDSEAQCEFPCKVKCNKKIWTESESQVWTSIVEKDLELHPECILNEVKNNNLILDVRNKQESLPLVKNDLADKTNDQQRFAMANLKQRIKKILNKQENSSIDKINRIDW